MKLFSPLLIILLFITSCSDKTQKGSFKVMGEIKNTEDQQVYLEQLYFSEQAPQVLDTADMKGGKFTLSAIAPEEGLFRIRMEKAQGGFLFINDADDIKFTADLKDVSLEGPTFDTRANGLLKGFLISLNDQRDEADEARMKMENLKTTANNDSAINAEAFKITAINERYNQYITKFIDTISDPVVAMFALGYTEGIDPKELSGIVPNMNKRFPNHEGINAIVTRYNQYLAAPPASKAPGIGDMAPEITMNDESGKSFSLSQLKGKYVLIDFWASWCGPCRRENPNLVAAHEKFRDKNFTILGVSLDQDKAAWLKAIKDDKLNWKQISDLQYWNSAAVPLYGFDGIPYNVLVDPQGKIIATGLREEGLITKLEEVLK